MKKLFFLFFLFALVATTQSFAQGFAKGQKDLNIGIGLGSTYGMPIGASLDLGVSENISIGAYVGYASKKESFGVPGFGSYTWKYTAILIGARGAYHFAVNDKFDPYIGVLLGYNVGSVKLDGTAAGSVVSPTYGGLAWAGFLGARYSFGKSVNAFAELGYGIAILQVGLNFKF